MVKRGLDLPEELSTIFMWQFNYHFLHTCSDESHHKARADVESCLFLPEGWICLNQAWALLGIMFNDIFQIVDYFWCTRTFAQGQKFMFLVETNTNVNVRLIGKSLRPWKIWGWLTKIIICHSFAEHMVKQPKTFAVADLFFSQKIENSRWVRCFPIHNLLLSMHGPTKTNRFVPLWTFAPFFSAMR